MKALPGGARAQPVPDRRRPLPPRPFNLQAHVRAAHAYSTAALVHRTEVASRPFKPLSLPSAPGRGGLVLVEPCPCWGCRWPAATRASRGSMEGGKSGSCKPTQVRRARRSTQPWRSCHTPRLACGCTCNRSTQLPRRASSLPCRRRRRRRRRRQPHAPARSPSQACCCTARPTSSARSVMPSASSLRSSSSSWLPSCDWTPRL